MEKIKINENSYELVIDGYKLNSEGGKIIFLPGTRTFEQIEDDLKAAGTLILLDNAEEPWISRDDLTYAGQLTKDSAYIVGTEKVQSGMDDNGNPVYEQQDVIGTVMVAVFRLPDVREQYATLEAKMEYLAMMTDVEMEV